MFTAPQKLLATFTVLVALIVLSAALGVVLGGVR
jgi:hypothetical protein